MIFAIPAAAPATPPKPSAAAMSAITRNVRAQPSIVCSFSFDSCRRTRGGRKRFETLSVGLTVACHTPKTRVGLHIPHSARSLALKFCLGFRGVIGGGGRSKSQNGIVHECRLVRLGAANPCLPDMEQRRAATGSEPPARHRKRVTN